MSGIKKLLESIEQEFEGKFAPGSEKCFLFDLADAHEALFGIEGMRDPDTNRYKGIKVLVPIGYAEELTIHAEELTVHGEGLPVPAKGLPPAICDSTDFVGHVQLKSGLVVPEDIAKESGLSYAPYTPPKNLVFYFY